MANSNVDLVQALDKIRLNNLYVHNDELSDVAFTNEKLKDRKVYLVETLAVVNALVDRGTMLLYGGHGGGKTTLAKYLGQIFYRLSKDEIEDCILRGHPQLTEEKILGSLDIAQLTGRKNLNKKDQIDVIWNDFVDSEWKIIDELNRLSPYAQNILLSLLAESSVKYHNESKRLPNFSVYATMNPPDGTSNWEMSLPFKDRFALALPITMPDYESLSTIGKKDKSSKQDDLSTYLKDFDLKEVQDNIKGIKYTEDAELFINFIISSYRLCDRISKESNDSTSVEKDLCKGCHFNVPDKVCNKIKHPLSVRVKEDLYRYGKALAWFLGDKEVEQYHIKTIAPYMIWHRSELSKIYKFKYGNVQEQNEFITNIDLDATKEIIDKIEQEFGGIKEDLKTFDKIKKGKLTIQELNDFLTSMKNTNNNFLIAKKEIIPILDNEYSSVYQKIIDYNTQIGDLKDIDKLKELKDKLLSNYNIPNRQFLADSIERKIRTVGTSSLKEELFKIPMETFIYRVDKKCPELAKKIKLSYPAFPATFSPAIRKQETIADIADSEYDLTMERISESGGKYSLRFKYRGKTDTSVYIFLKESNAN
jgi:MoxR-like ATPase